MTENMQKNIQQAISKHKVVLFMKGEKDAPMCGYSAGLVDILNSHKVDFEAINVLAIEGLRDGIKEFSSWPTIPQLFINGTFVGGYDIVTGYNNDNKLSDMLK